MCFSATASFTSAAVLASTGAAAMILNKDPNQRGFVALPFIFGAQQAAEGMVWLTLQDSNLYSFQLGAVVAFIFIAFALWPAWIPRAILKMETVPRRKLFLYISQAMGLFFAVVATYVIWTGGPRSEIVGQCLNYGFEKNTASFFPPNMHAIFYFSSTVLPFFISSIKWVRTTGFLILAGLLITLSSWKYATTSVWCFFAAIASIYICVHVYREQRGHAPLFAKFCKSM